MITLFTTFKDFKGDDAIRQTRSIQSWQAIAPGVEIILFGNSMGAREIAEQYKLLQITDVPAQQNRLVMVDKMFERAQKVARHDLMMYCNGDMMFSENLVDRLTQIHRKRFLACGRRWNIDIHRDEKFSREWLARQIHRARATLHPEFPYAIDYFAFRRGTFTGLPPLCVGTVAWDNYMIKHCHLHRIPVYDLTPIAVALHQKHDYAYLPKGETEFNQGEFAEYNRRLSGSSDYVFSLLDATHVVEDSRIGLARSPEYVNQRVERLFQRKPVLARRLLSWKLRYILCWLFPSL